MEAVKETTPIDRRLQTLSRRVSADPGDLAAARSYRASLTRLTDTEAFAALVQLEGALAATRCWGTPFKRGLPVWSRVTADRSKPVLLPRLPEGERLVERWRLPGVAVWLSDGLVLVERPDRSLSAHEPESGACLWEQPTVRGDLPNVSEGFEDLGAERFCSLAWTASPWGAVEFVAHYEAQVHRRRVGRWHSELGRVTDSLPVERGPTEVQLTAQVLIAHGGAWTASRNPPEEIVEHAGVGEGFVGSSLALAEWFEELNALSLDPATPSFAVSWGVPTLDDAWAVFEVSHGVLGPAGWEPSEGDPFRAAVPDACPGPGGTTYRVHGDRVRHEGQGQVLAEHDLHGLNSPQLIGTDGAVLIAGFRGGTCQLLRLDWDGEAPRPWPEAWPESFDGRLRLVGWDAVPGNPDLCGQILVAGGLLFVQQGGDCVVAYGSEESA